jgi:nickel-dependent lactate racemase
VIVVDDMNRPTPAARVLPWVLRQFAQAGIKAADVTIVMARGSHGLPCRDIIAQKTGREAAQCRIVLHDPCRRTIRIGRTSSGTPVFVNREVVGADFIMGIGGLYPNHTAGFGGGSKLIMGVLDLRVISALHHGTEEAGWGGDALASRFRRDLDEIARLVGLEFLVTLHVNADCKVVRVRCGDPSRYYPEEVAFAREAFRAPVAEGADVVIANAFPNDLSVTFALMKGDFPLRLAPPRASRILIAACSEGAGSHGVYPVVAIPPLHEQRDRLRRLSLLSAGELAAKAWGRVRRLAAPGAPPKSMTRDVSSARPSHHAHPIWLYHTAAAPGDLPATARGARIVGRWTDVLDAVAGEQRQDARLQVFVYPCSPLQVVSAPP